MPPDEPQFISDPDFCYCVHPRGERGTGAPRAVGASLMIHRKDASDYRTAVR